MLHQKNLKNQKFLNISINKCKNITACFYFYFLSLTNKNKYVRTETGSNLQLTPQKNTRLFRSKEIMLF